MKLVMNGTLMAAVIVHSNQILYRMIQWDAKRIWNQKKKCEMNNSLFVSRTVYSRTLYTLILLARICSIDNTIWRFAVIVLALLYPISFV